MVCFGEFRRWLRTRGEGGGVSRTGTGYCSHVGSCSADDGDGAGFLICGAVWAATWCHGVCRAGREGTGECERC